ncbi:DUF3945 domain-containing protein [Flavobacterium qiangtangense]|uniref:DUF3945 domain-containing protein n=1 Tax=Flavobacterium qiangtangense TaxID=1442595 RepID=A0ABW1PJ55_9FLAO
MEKEPKEKEINRETQPDMLLARDMEKNTIRAVTGIGPKGRLETVSPKAKNQSQFLRINPHGDAFSNFFSNFLGQLKHPTRFAFFLAHSSGAAQKAAQLQRLADRPALEAGARLPHLKERDGTHNTRNHKNLNTMENENTAPDSGGYRYKAEDIDWATMNSMGLSQERLEKMNLMDSLLKGYKTNGLVPVTINLGTAVSRTDARLSLQANEDGKVTVAIHGVRKEPNLRYPFFGHEFTAEDKASLLQTGNMGRVVELENAKTGERIPSIISVDRLTNELVALRTEFMKIPDEIKGVKLDETQKQALAEGKPLYLEGMISKKGTEFSATVQFNADKHYVEFLFDRSNTSKQAQSNGQTNEQGKQQDQTQEAPKTFRGKELTDEQHKDFKNGQTVYIDGLKDKKGQPYQGYITFNNENGKTNFEFPNQYKERVKPAEAHKTQTEVNSDGKTNESTKKIKEPLKPGQQSPKDMKQQEQQEKAPAPAKSKGLKR